MFLTQYLRIRFVNECVQFYYQQTELHTISSAIEIIYNMTNDELR